MTRSGKVFSHEEQSKGNTYEASKRKEIVSSEGGPSKKIVPQGEAEELLRLIRKSDYKMVDQLS